MARGKLHRAGSAVALAAALGACSRAPDLVPQGTSDAARLAHTLGIVRTATAADPKVLRVLFYGQSISSTRWTDRAVAHLRARFPDVRFVATNLAIPGFSAVDLERTAARDLAAAYPDLVVFHVFGDHRAYERIIRIIRSTTAADVIVETDHPTRPPEPLCPEGPRLSLEVPPGCTGHLWLRQRVWEDHMSGAVIPRLAAEYGLAVEPRRRWWAAYLERHGLAPADLLADQVHPNDAGWRLAAAILAEWFEGVAARWRGERWPNVVSAPPRASWSFTGNRVELVASAPLAGKVEARVDGAPPVAIDGCWQQSRVTALAEVPIWPTLRQVTVAPGFHAAERWTVTITGLSPAQDRFRFRLAGDRTGPDGEGSSDADFRSPSGRVSIAARDWVLAEGVTAMNGRVPEGFRASWTRRFACGDQPPVTLAPGRQEWRYLVATGLPNEPHRLTLRLAPGAARLVSEVRAYRPPLAP